MGAWAIDSFGNDDALDWLGDLEEHSDLRLVEQTIQRVLTAGSDYLQAPEATQALAAAEVIASAFGNPGPAAKDRKVLVDWLARVRPSPSASLAESARGAIDRIVGENSELNELWEDTDDYDAWVEDVKNLRDRLDA
jgi:hypothetical protein